VKDGRAHVYIPLVERQEATRSEIRHLVSRFFKDSHELLVLNILEDQGVEAGELKRLRQVLQQRTGEALAAETPEAETLGAKQREKRDEK
jgi:predicted transcriptional regulator